MTDTWATKVLEGVTRWTKINGQEIVGPPLLDEHSVVAAIARHLAPGDDLVERLLDAIPATQDGVHTDQAEVMQESAARLSALTAQVADAREQRSDAEARMETAEAERDALRAKVARLEGARDANYNHGYADCLNSGGAADAVAGALREAAEVIDKRHRGNLPDHIKSEDGNAIRAMIKTDTCPPCHGDCNQGRDCPARNK